MGNNRSKKHHFVPKVLQKAFCSHGDSIWYSARSKEGIFQVVEQRNIESTFRIRDLYTILDGDTLSDRVEREHYGRVDDYLGHMLPDVLGALERGQAPVFSAEPLKSLHAVVYEMIKRTPEFFDNFDEVKIGREVVEDTLGGVTKEHSLEDVKTLRGYLKDTTHLRKIGRSIRTTSIASKSDKILDELRTFEPRWVTALGRQSFILSSKIAYRIGNGGPNGFSNPNMEIWMPISPNFALVLLRDPGKIYPLRYSASRDLVREVNEYGVRNSSYVASHSSRLLSSLIFHGGILKSPAKAFSTRSTDVVE